ncbi:conserved hypothetical protein [Gammaproteobacteria bacterium]
MFYQNVDPAPDDFQHFGCTFSALVMSRELLGGIPWMLSEAYSCFSLCRKMGYITGDLNRDGDYNDPGEDEIKSYQGIIDFCKLPLRVIPPESLGLPMGLDRNGVKRILPLAEPLDPAKYWTLEAWHWRLTHFVAGDGTGRRPVKYDPIAGGSLTVRNGKCESLRIFEIRKWEVEHA